MSTWETSTDIMSMLTACGGQVVTVGGGTFGTSPFGADYFGGSAEIIAIFDKQFVEAAGVEGVAPVLTCRSIDVAPIKHGDPVTIGETSYLVRGVQPDGTGVTALILEEQ